MKVLAPRISKNKARYLGIFDKIRQQSKKRYASRLMAKTYKVGHKKLGSAERKVFNQASHRVKRATQDIPYFNELLDNKQESVDVIALKEDQSRIILYTDQTYLLSQILPKLQHLSLKVVKEASYRLMIDGTTCNKQHLQGNIKNFAKDF